MRRPRVWLVTGRADLRRFLSTFFTTHGIELRSFGDGNGLFVALGQGDMPDVVLCDDPPPSLPRATVEARLRELAPSIRQVFLRDADDTLGPGEMRRFATDDFTLNATELVELVERLVADSTREDTPAGGIDLGEAARGSLLTTISTFVQLLERYEFLNGGNGPLVQRYAVEVARELGLSSSRVDAIAAASLLYDVGMMRVRPEIKLKTSPLTEDERATIRQHPRFSAEFCERLQLPWDVRRYVLHHHERYDGTGYPDGLAGRAIPIGARIIGVGDAYFAMISKRAVREAMTEDEALAELNRGAGHQFDPEIVEVWTSLIQVHFLGDQGDRPALRVALVDDDRELHFLLEARFRALNYQLVAIEESVSVLKGLVKAAPEAIIVNADLSWIDGFQLLHQVRQEPALGGVPFLFTSVRNASDLTRSRARASGADDFIVRPCPLQELVMRVNTAIRKKRRITDQHFVRPLAAAGIHGRLADMSLTEICQVLAQGFKTARVTIDDGDAPGELFFREGQLKHAVYRDLSGPDALYSLLRVGEGEFSIEHGVEPPADTVNERLDFLLMEGMRLIDEERRETAQ